MQRPSLRLKRDGRLARLQFRALADGPKGPAIGGAELLGLGRSIYAVLDRKLVAHALESVQQRLQLIDLHLNLRRLNAKLIHPALCNLEKRMKRLHLTALLPGVA